MHSHMNFKFFLLLNVTKHLLLIFYLINSLTSKALMHNFLVGYNLKSDYFMFLGIFIKLQDMSYNLFLLSYIIVNSNYNCLMYTIHRVVFKDSLII
jgi:hypothetical protein